MTTETKAPEKKLFYCNPEVETKLKAAIEKTLPLVQLIVDAYASVPGQLALTSEALQAIFSDLPAFINQAQVSFYQNTFGALHSQMGFNQETGLKLVADKLPDFTALTEAIKQFHETTQSNYREYASYSYFEINEQQAAINQTAFDLQVEREKLYLEHPKEMEFVELVEKMGEAIQNYSAFADANYFMPVNDHTGFYPYVNFQKIAELFETVNGHVRPGGFKVNKKALIDLKSRLQN